VEATGEPPLPTGVAAAQIHGRSPWYLVWLRLRRNFLALACGGLFVVIVLFCLAARCGPTTWHIPDRTTITLPTR